MQRKKIELNCNFILCKAVWYIQNTKLRLHLSIAAILMLYNSRAAKILQILLLSIPVWYYFWNMWIKIFVRVPNGSFCNSRCNWDIWHHHNKSNTFREVPYKISSYNYIMPILNQINNKFKISTWMPPWNPRGKFNRKWNPSIHFYLMPSKAKFPLKVESQTFERFLIVWKLSYDVYNCCSNRYRAPPARLENLLVSIVRTQ